jgi:hypothetical protein
MLVLSILLLATSSLPAQASVIAVFDNRTYVDTSGGPPVPSSDALQALLTSQGNTVHPFTGLTAADFTTALSGANLIVFPNLLNFGALASDLSASAKATLAGYVSNGGGLISVGDSAARLLNAIFYPTCDFVTVFCLATSGSAGPSFLDSAVAAGTPFAMAPVELTTPPQAGNGLNPFAFTPPGGANLYRDHVAGSPNSATVLTAPFGSGHYGFLAWNFADAAPLGGLNGGWNDVLNLTVSAVASAPVTAVPEPASSSLLALGLLALGGTAVLRRGSNGSIPS